MKVYKATECDKLIISNTTNRVKLIADKDKENQFIVSPFIFQSANNVTFYLSKENHSYLFNNLNLEDMFKKQL